MTAKLIEFRPGVFARVGETVRINGWDYAFDGERWAPINRGHRASGPGVPPELQTVAPGRTYTSREPRARTWESQDR